MKLDLNGTWQLTYEDIHSKEAWGRTIPAAVPGDVHLDLMAAGLILDPLISDNNSKCLWTEDKQWWYTRTFIAESGFAARRLELVCEGLDLTADIWINGEKAGSANNMFIGHRFEVSGHVIAGENTITVRIDPGFAAVEGKALEPYSKSWNAFDLRRPWMRKAQQCFYWDVAPRMVTCGIWKGIFIESFDEAALRDISVKSNLSQGKAEVFVTAELEVFTNTEQHLAFSGRLSGHGTELKWVSNAVYGAGIHTVTAQILLDNPKLWWPAGMGDPNLYLVEAELRNSLTDGLLGECSLRYGVRTVEILQEPINDREKTFTFVINGQKVFCKGGNWVPTDSIYARCSNEKVIKLLDYAKECNFNMIRIWGGGIYECDAFYDTCDRLGLMVWQDFMFACGYYPDNDATFCLETEREAVSVVRRLRNHSCVVVWSGNNENQVMFNCDRRPDKVFFGEKLFNGIIENVCAHLDPKRPYRRGSPYPGSVLEGDQHEWDYTLGWRDQNPKALKFWDYPEKNHKFLSEFGIFAPSAMSSIQKFMGEQPIVKDNPVWTHHTNYFAHNGHIEGIIAMYYRDEGCATLDEYIFAGQMVQAEAMKYILEEFRSRMYECSGTLFWEYNDTWGHIGYSLVDYYLSRKALYFYMRRAFRHLHVLFKNDGAALLLANDTASNYTLTVEYGLMTLQGETLYCQSHQISLHASSSAFVADMAEAVSSVADKASVFSYARVWQDGQLLDSNRCFLVPIKQVKTPADTLTWSLMKTAPRQWLARFTTVNYAWMVSLTLPEGCEPSDNAFDIWPGQSFDVLISSENELDSLEMKIGSVNRYNSRA